MPRLQDLLAREQVPLGARLGVVKGVQGPDRGKVDECISNLTSVKRSHTNVAVVVKVEPKVHKVELIADDLR